MPNGIFTLTQVNQAVRQGAWTGFIAPTWVEYLVVAGGGGAGRTANGAGGGGGGGLLTGVVSILAGTSYTVTVGSGGAGSTSTGAAGSSGGASVLGSISAAGGGGGASGSTASTFTNATSGGSGGGGTGGSSGSGTAGAQGTSGQGNAGGSGSGNYGGGGGGAGTLGLSSPNTVAGNGGSGIASAISGAVVAYAGGGAGGINATGSGAGGVGGGGSTGLTADSTGVSGGGNTGGGGGGGWGSGANQNGGSGGSGVVIIRYPGTVQYFTGGTLSYANGYVIHTFNASGTLAPTTPTPYVANDYQISRSLRFNSADSAYLNRTFSSSGNQKTWTWSGWIKRGKLDVTQYSGFISNTGNGFRINDDSPGNQIRVRIAGTSSIYAPVLRDPSAWYHIVIAIDTTQVVAADRIKVYINNQLATLASGSIPAQNSDTGVNTAALHGLGADPTPTQYFDGYMTEINFIDGQALTPSSFGYYDFNTGVWAPTRYVGVYGTNGFYLNFSDNSNTTAATLGRDYSGNSNNWTPNNFSVSAGAGNDSLVDVPTNWGTDTGVGGSVRGNYATLNPIIPASVALSNGNLDLTATVESNTYATLDTGLTGKWYAEFTVNTSASFWPWIGTRRADTLLGGNGSAFYPGIGTGGEVGYLNSGSKYINGNSSAYGATFTTGDIIGIAVDCDNGATYFSKNGVFQNSGVPTSGASRTGAANTWTGASQSFFIGVAINNGSVVNCNFGQRPFAYTAPSGFKALNTQNLPTPTIGATTATQAGKFFNPVLYTGNGFPTSGTQSVTGVGFQPDWVWIKSRSAAGSNTVTDVVRGINSQLLTNTTGVEQTNTDNITALNSDGFSLGSNTTGSTNVNVNGQTYVAWNWKANGAGVTNTAGSITSTVSANTTSGFSVVTYTGNSTNGATIGHGLGVAPRMVIVKSRNDTFDWIVWSRSFTTNNTTAFLNTTDAAGAYNVWSSTLPSSTVITLPSSGYVNGSTKTYVAYCFAEVPGYSRFGSYVGNGSADGPFVFCGFRPAYVMIKRADATGNWILKDTTRAPYNADGNTLIADLADAEYGPSNTLIDELSNGFKCRDASASINFSGNTYIFMAFASAPQKFALAR
jgi:hypothetical protein